VDGQKHHPLSIVKIEQLLARRGVIVPYHTLHRLRWNSAASRLGPRMEAGCLLPLPEPYDQPVFTRVKVHRDYHVEVARVL
jgi:hypothetical protein